MSNTTLEALPEQFRKTPIKGGKKRLLYMKHYRGIVAAVKSDIKDYDKGEESKRLLYVPNLKAFCEEIRQRDEIRNCVEQRKIYLSKWIKRHPHLPLKKTDVGKICSYLH